MTWRRWKLALAVVFYALLLVFLVKFLRGTDWGQLARLRFDAIYLIAAIPLSLVPRLLQPLAWGALIEGYGERAPRYAQITRVYATSWLARYIPGKIASIGSKVFLGRGHGISTSTLAATSVAEAALQLSTALAVALAVVALRQGGDAIRLGDDVWLLAAIALIAISLALLPPVFNRLVSGARSLLRVPAVPGIGTLSFGTLLASGAIYTVVNAFSGVPVYFVLHAMYPAIQPTVIPELTASVLIAGAMGTLAVFAPAGLGVREGILLLLLDALMPTSVAVAAVVALRLWSAAMDVLYYAVAVLLDRARPLEHRRT